MIVLPWFYYFHEAKKLGSELVDGDGIRTEWELNHIASKKMKSERDD